MACELSELTVITTNNRVTVAGMLERNGTDIELQELCVIRPVVIILATIVLTTRQRIRQAEPRNLWIWRLTQAISRLLTGCEPNDNKDTGSAATSTEALGAPNTHGRSKLGARLQSEDSGALRRQGRGQGARESFGLGVASEDSAGIDPK